MDPVKLSKLLAALERGETTAAAVRSELLDAGVSIEEANEIVGIAMGESDLVIDNPESAA
jgi:hypothetical protein